MITQHAPPDWFYNLSLSISFVLAQGLVLMLFLPYISFILPVSQGNSLKTLKVCTSNTYCSYNYICANVTY